MLHFGYILLIIFLTGVLYILYKRMSRTSRVCIVLLGDLGRSPRMTYHCLSFAKEGYKVEVVAYQGSHPHRDVMDDKRITVHYKRDFPKIFSGCPRLIAYILKTIWQAVTLFFSLLLIPKSSIYLVQNPPSIPPLAVVWLITKILSSTFVIDWHNYGFTILSLTLRPSHPLVSISRIYEGIFGRLANWSICVTKAMQSDLLKRWRIKSYILYDRPHETFKQCSPATSHRLFEKISRDYICFSSRLSNQTRFTETVDDSGIVSFRSERPALLVSSTSWTEDEDFGVLIQALIEYDRCASANDESDLPDLVVVITGKGPLKEFYREKLTALDWKRVEVCLMWLEVEDYPLLLGSADLGVCLHTSSSGLDLPMKVVDMFGCGLPVCAIQFSCLDELVQHDVNGQVFTDATVLAAQFKDLLVGFPDGRTKLHDLRKNLQLYRQQRWHDNWKKVVLPLVGLKNDA